MRDRVALAVYVLAWLVFYIFMILLSFVLASCGAREPGDFLGWYRPETLVTICHIETDENGYGVYETMQLNRGKAEWHLDEHEWDSVGECET